jgi:deferrochelatase/peroxidase EfeB
MTTPDDDRSFRVDRRRFLQVGALSGGTAVVAGLASRTPAGAEPALPDNPQDAAAASFPDGASITPEIAAELQSFEGLHQMAMLSEPMPATSFVSYDVIAENRSELKDLLRTITNVMRAQYAGGEPVFLGPASPPSDNGILGPVVPARQVAFLLGMGSTLFDDDRYGLGAQKPSGLSVMESFPNDNLDAAQCGGDLSVQFTAAHADVVLHAMREVAMVTRGGMQPRWRLDGFGSPPRPSGTPRNLLGFKDGIANPDTSDATQMEQLIWVQPGDGPSWTTGGTFQVVRIIRMLTEFWDRVNLYEQEAMIGRRRDTGAPLDGDNEYSTIDYAADPLGNVIPLTAHIRLANPRTASTEKNRILRRGWNYDRGLDVNGNLDMGLLFTCYQQDIARQFITVQTRLVGEPLVDYISPIGGGYFFVPPGLNGTADYFGARMFA